MSTLRTTTLKHGSSTIDNIVFDNQGRSTFGGNALFVNAQNQRVGVNTTSPTVALDVDGAINATGNVVFGGQLNLTGDLAVNTNTLFVDASTGFVGLGTASPLTRLHIEGTGASDSRLRCTRSGVNGEFGIASNNIVVTALGSDGTNGGIDFYTGGDRKLTLTPTGRLGINTATPNQTLEVTGAGAVIRLNNTDSGANLWGELSNPPGGNDSQALVFTARGGASSFGGYSFNSTDGSSTNTIMVVRASGAVGIGTTNPQTGRAPLHLHTSNSTTNIHLTNNTSGQGSQDGLTLFMEGTTSAGVWYREDGPFRFATNNAEKARIDSAGRMLIGTTSSLQSKYSGSAFQPGFQNAAVAGTGGFFRYSNNNDGAALVFNKSRNATVGSHTIVNNNETVGYLGFTGSDGTQFQTAASITGVTDGTPGTNDMPGRLVFSTTAAGASIPTERMRISSNGNIAVGGGSNQHSRLRLEGTNGSSATGARGFGNTEFVPTTMTNYYIAFHSEPDLADGGSFTELTHFKAQPQSTTASLTTQYGFWADASLTRATNNYGFYSNIASDTGRWNFYANGTASNYFAGDVRFGASSRNGIVGGTVNGKAVDGTTGVLQSSRDIGTEAAHVNFYNSTGGTTKVGSITTSGSTTAFNTSSDYRLKENVVPMTGAADRVKALKPCRFNFIADPSVIVDGFLAHEAQEIVPEAVTGTKDGEEMQAMDAAKLVPLLTAALQEALERIKVLEQRVLE